MIGDLNKRIDIIATTKVGDGMGSFTETNTTVASSIPAAIWPTSAKDMTVMNTTTMVISHRVRVRYRSVLRSSWRLKFGNRYFAIVSIIDPNEEHKFLDLMCKESA